MGMFSSFSRTPKHSRFEYKPLYYDPEKEEKKQKRINFSGKRKLEGFERSRISGQMKSARVAQRKKRTESHRYLRYAMLLGMFGLFFLFSLEYIGLTTLFIGLLIFMVIFIVTVPKA